ncbi:hypothetical protein FB567DRAFT_533737, partial [Paraphoma chrysanthemicola]
MLRGRNWEGASKLTYGVRWGSAQASHVPARPPGHSHLPVACNIIWDGRKGLRTSQLLDALLLHQSQLAEGLSTFFGFCFCSCPMMQQPLLPRRRHCLRCTYDGHATSQKQGLADALLRGLRASHINPENLPPPLLLFHRIAEISPPLTPMTLGQLTGDPASHIHIERRPHTPDLAANCCSRLYSVAVVQPANCVSTSPWPKDGVILVLPSRGRFVEDFEAVNRDTLSLLVVFPLALWPTLHSLPIKS